MKLTPYRMLAAGEQEWSGNARDTEHAEEKCFWDELPGSLVRYTLQKWGRVKFGKSISGPGWVTIYGNQPLSFN